jgi:biopolymer transport protein ExbD
MARLSLRERRQRKQFRRKKEMRLNIVSLIDIFTVLVFFLLLNFLDLELLPENRKVQLPESLAEAKPQDTVVVSVNRSEIVVQGVTVANVDEVMGSAAPTIPALKQALLVEFAKAPPEQPALQADGKPKPPQRAVTIMGDREIPYRLLRKVLSTCSDADFGNISLAVLQKSSFKPVSVKTP